MRCAVTLWAIMLLALSACGNPAAPGAVSPSDLKAAPTTVAFAGRTLVLEASLWRDFMPISPPDGRPLTAVLRVKTVDGSSVPASVRGDAVWVLNDGEMWSTTPQEERPRTETGPVYEVVARDGPKWGPGVAVDVVIRLRDATGASRLLRAPDQMILGAF